MVGLPATPAAAEDKTARYHECDVTIYAGPVIGGQNRRPLKHRASNVKGNHPLCHARFTADDRRRELDPVRVVLMPLSPTYPEGTHLLTISRGNGAKRLGLLRRRHLRRGRTICRGVEPYWTRRAARARRPGRDPPDRQVQQDQQVRQVPMVRQDQRDPQAPQVPRARRDWSGHQVRWDPRDCRAQREPQGQAGSQGPDGDRMTAAGVRPNIGPKQGTGRDNRRAGWDQRARSRGRRP